MNRDENISNAILKNLKESTKPKGKLSKAEREFFKSLSNKKDYSKDTTLYYCPLCHRRFKYEDIKKYGAFGLIYCPVCDDCFHPDDLIRVENNKDLDKITTNNGESIIKSPLDKRYKYVECIYCHKKFKSVVDFKILNRYNKKVWWNVQIVIKN